MYHPVFGHLHVKEQRTANFTYDVHGNLIHFDSPYGAENDEFYLYDRGHRVATFRPNGSYQQTYYLYGQKTDELLAIDNGGATYWAMTDYLGTVHVDQAALAGKEGRSGLPIESVKRLCCDGHAVVIT